MDKKNQYFIKEVKSASQWDEFALSFKESTFINSWGWGEFEKSMGSHFEQLGIFNQDRLVGLCPIKLLNGRRGRFLHVMYGPLIDWGDLNLASFVIDFLKERARSEGAWMVRFSPLIQFSDDAEKMLREFGTVRASSFKSELDNSITIDLKLGEEEILKRMRKSTRYSIKQAKKMGIVVRVEDDLKYLSDFWNIYKDMAERNRWSRHYSFEHIKKQYEIFRERGEAKIFFSESNGELMASSIFMFFNKKIAYAHSGSLTKYRNTPAMYPILWEAMRYGIKNRFEELSLWGVCDKDKLNHPWYGLSTFKRGFGGEEVHHVHARDIVISPLGYLTRTFEKLENWRYGLN